MKAKLPVGGVYAQFLIGFAQTVHATGQDEAHAIWTAFSRDRSEMEIEEIESGGFESGINEGLVFERVNLLKSVSECDDP